MTLAIEEVLAVWRDAERVRDALPPTHPSRAAIDAEIRRLRAMYARMTDLASSTGNDLAASSQQIASAMATLDRVRSRLDLGARSLEDGVLSEASDPMGRLAGTDR